MKYIILVLCFVPGLMQAQINLRPGYIITNNNDTVYGSIDFRSDDRNAHQCTFKDPATGTVTNYRPGDIYAYRFTDDGMFYVTRTVTVNKQEETYFLEYIIQGIISMYYLSGEPIRYFFETEDGRMLEVTKNEELITTDDGKSGIKRDTRYIGVLQYIFGESERAKKKIPLLKFSKKDLAEITREYHYDVCTTGDDCIEFESTKDLNYIIISCTLLAGAKKHSFHLSHFDKYQGVENMNSATPSIGIDIGISAPRLSRALSARIALEGSSFYGKRFIPSGSRGYYELKVKSFFLDNKIGLRYALLSGKMRPFIEAGGTQTFLIGTDITSSSEIVEDDKVKKVPDDYSEITKSHYLGYYVGAGLIYGIGKHALSLSGYYCSKNGDDISGINKIRTLEVVAGFTF